MTSFADRAVMVCLRELANGIINERSIRDILKSKNPKVEVFESYLEDPDPMVRKTAARIVAKKGNISKVIDVAIGEEDTLTLLCMLELIGDNGKGVEEVASILASDNMILRDAAISMFRRTKRTDLLLPLIFDRDAEMADRIKRYMGANL